MVDICGYPGFRVAIKWNARNPLLRLNGFLYLNFKIET